MSDETKPEIEEDDEEAGSTRRLDQELRVMGDMIRKLAPLPDAAKARIMQYLCSRFMT